MKKIGLILLIIGCVTILPVGLALAVPSAAVTWASGASLTVDTWYNLTQQPAYEGNVWVGEHSTHDIAGDYWLFEYVLWNEDYKDSTVAHNPITIAAFKIYNPFGFTLSAVSNPTKSNQLGFTGWSGTIYSSYVVWSANDSASMLANGTGAGYFDYKVAGQDLVVGLVPAESWDGGTSEDADGYVSGPTPEPSSLLLLGSGLLGVALLGVARRRKIMV